MIQKNSAEFSVQCTFQGNYNEPILTFKVPMDALKAAGALEFEMVFHGANEVFEKVNMRNSETKEVIGEATFSVV